MLGAERAYTTHLKQELDLTKESLEIATTMLTESKKLVQEQETQLQSWQRKVGQKQAEIDSLKSELEISKPLVEVGVSTRKLFLEQVRRAREPAQRLKSGEGLGYGTFYINQDLIEAGNKAIHNANGDADFALFKTGFLSSECILVPTFKELYQQNSVEYRNFWPKIIRQAVDMSMTVQMFGMSSGNWDDDGQDDHFRIVAQLIKDWDNQKDKTSFEDFDAGAENQDKLMKLKDLTIRTTKLRSLQPAARFFQTQVGFLVSQYFPEFHLIFAQVNDLDGGSLCAGAAHNSCVPDPSKYVFRQSNVSPAGFRLFPFTFQVETQTPSDGKCAKQKKPRSRGFELDVTPFIAGSDRNSREARISDNRRVKGGRN